MAIPQLTEEQLIQAEAAKRAGYIQKIFETVRYFWEMWEEGSDGNTGVIMLLKPANIGNVALRNLVLGDFYRNRGFSLSEAAIELAQWLELEHAGPPVDAAMDADLAILCKSAVNPFQPVSDTETVIQRSFVRLVRYLQQTRLANEGAHSRCFEFFVADEFVPTGYSKNGGNHPEHVVPCAFLRDHCIASLENGISVEEAAQAIRPFLAIVIITEEECRHLDTGPTRGGLGLKAIMPANWDFKTGDIFARLHAAGIAFEPPIMKPAALHRPTAA